MSNRVANASIRYLICAVVLISIICVVVPLFPGMPAGGLDPSWRYAMNQAVAQGLVFGRDVIFTFGPYASIYTADYHPATDALMICGSLYFALSFGGILIFLGNRHGRWMPVLVTIVLFVTSVYSRDILFYLYALLVAMAVVCIDRDETDADGIKAARRSGGQSWKIFFFFLPLGLLPLIKGSFFILACATVILTLGLWCRRKNYTYAIAAVLVPAVGLILFWLLAGQPFDALFTYLRTMFTSISGYTEAMAAPGRTLEIWLYLGAAIILSISVIAMRVTRPIYRGYLLIMLGLSLFLTFKAGFVRHDGHALAATFFLLLCSLLFAPIIPFSLRIVSISVCLVLAGISANFYSKLDLPAVKNIFIATYTRAFAGLNIRIFHREALSHRFDIAVDTVAKEANIPKLTGTADIYSYDQSVLIASGNEWKPRPVLQSYAAYTPAMLLQNARRLQSPDAPDNIIFKVEPIDGRLPSMEDGASWPAILTNYHPVEMRDGHLYLVKNATQQRLREKAISTGTYSLGQSVEIPDTAGSISAEIHISRSVWGMLANTLFRPSPLRIELKLTDGGIRTYKLISTMTETGILISPLIENTIEFALAYGDSQNLVNQKVQSFRIVASSKAFEWNDKYQVSFKEMKFPQYDGVRSLLKYDPSFAVAAGVSPRTDGQCGGSIDAVNGSTPAPSRFRSSGWLEVSGWLASSVNRGNVPRKTLLVLTNKSGDHFFFNTRVSPRPDIGVYFGNPELAAAGYTAMIDTSEFVGEYALGLGYVDKDKLFICPQFGIPGIFGVRPGVEISNATK